MTEQDIITPDIIEDAEYVSSAWRTASQSRLDGIFETGRRLIEIRDKYKDDKGKWSRLIGDNQWAGQSLLPFQKSHTNRLVRIAGDCRLPPHAGVLPDDSTTLGKLVSLTDERFQELLDDGTINPNMGRNDMSEPAVSKKAWVPFVPDKFASAGNQISALADMSSHELVDKCLQREAAGLSAAEAAAEIKIHSGKYEALKNIVLLQRCNYLTKMDRIAVDRGVEAINEHKQISPVYERLKPIAAHMWGDKRGPKGRDADIKRRTDEFYRVIRQLSNTCNAAPDIDIPYLDQDRLESVQKTIGEAVSGLNKLRATIKHKHE